MSNASKPAAAYFFYTLSLEGAQEIGARDPLGLACLGGGRRFFLVLDAWCFDKILRYTIIYRLNQRANTNRLLWIVDVLTQIGRVPLTLFKKLIKHGDFVMLTFRVRT